jgi:hypothetical protein
VGGTDVGLHTIHFQSPKQLRSDLHQWKLL